MATINSNPFYRTSFEIAAAQPETDILWELVMSVRNWICRKWDKRGAPISQDLGEWSSFKFGRSARLSDSQNTVRFASAALYGDGVRGIQEWACSISERYSVKGYAERIWTTDVTFVAISEESAAVSIVVSYVDRSGFLGPVQSKPSLTVPGLVRVLMNNESIVCTTSGKPLTVWASSLAEGDFDEFWSFVINPERSTPIVYVSPYFPTEAEAQFLVDPRDIASVLGPSAIVYYSPSAAFSSEMMAKIPNRKLRCTSGALRVYLPNVRLDNPFEPTRHRFFRPQDIEEYGRDAMLEILRRALAQDELPYDAKHRVDALRTQIRLHSTERRAEARVNAAEDYALGEIEKTEQMLEGELNELKEEQLQRQNEIDDLKERCHDLEEKCSAYELALRSTSSEQEEQVSIGRWPMSTLEIVELYTQVFADRIDLTERAWKSLNGCRSDPDLLWNAMHVLCTIMYGLQSQTGGVDVQKEFSDNSTFTYASGAGTMTRKGNALMREYMDTFQGRELNCEAHIGAGNGRNAKRSIRIYFCYDDVTGKIIISSIGEHLKNYSTRKIH